MGINLVEVECPTCNAKIEVSLLSIAKMKDRYIVDSNCLACKTKASDIERYLNNTARKSKRYKVEKSYLAESMKDRDRGLVE